ncbi:MAG: non-canonical purine NTP pyrophosphatase [Cytophagales bacterium]|nr:non-canonical purine NTP pyrophosphatase [Cytophagales bacterium]
MNGIIIDQQRGAEGFGYDPIFLPDGNIKTLAEMSLDKKNTLSHRARAIEKLVTHLKQRNVSNA